MKISKAMWGVFFIAAAVLVIINQLGIDTGVSLWGLLFTVLLIPVVMSGLYYRNFFNVFFGIAIWLIVFAKPLDIQELVPWTILIAALFLSIGFSILVKPRNRFMGSSHHNHMKDERSRKDIEYETVNHVDGGDVNCSAVLCGSCKYLHSDSLRKAQMECSLGYLKVYFDNVRLHPDGAVINVNCSLGEMELYLPQEWQVLLNIDSILGNVSEQHHINPGNGPVLRINGSVKLGNIEIRYI